ASSTAVRGMSPREPPRRRPRPLETEKDRKTDIVHVFLIRTNVKRPDSGLVGCAKRSVRIIRPRRWARRARQRAFAHPTHAANSQPHAAVDEMRLACDVARLVRRQEQRQVRNLLRG